MCLLERRELDDKFLPCSEENGLAAKNKRRKKKAIVLDLMNCGHNINH